MSYLEDHTIQKDRPFSHHGRYGRLSYIAWTFIASLFYTAVLFVVIAMSFALSYFLGNGLSTEELFSSSLGYLLVILFVAVVIFFTVIFINITIRRLHDLNKSGWLWLLMLIPFLNILFWIYILCFKGTEGRNDYGEFRETALSEKYLGVLYTVFLAVLIVVLGETAVIQKMLILYKVCLN